MYLCYLVENFFFSNVELHTFMQKFTCITESRSNFFDNFLISILSFKLASASWKYVPDLFHVTDVSPGDSEARHVFNSL